LEVHYPANDTEFQVWDAKQQEVSSACRVVPTTSSQVAEILTVLTDSWCRFAVKGGGHARNADDSVSVGGVTVDLVRMKSLELSDDRTRARLGSGHVLHTLYSGLEAYNLSAIGGRVADVGLGGYALGGGISNFSPKYGLAVDNVFEYEVSSAAPSILIACSSDIL
jgi:FAD/FMN-containing dehydrogenase